MCVREGGSVLFSPRSSLTAGGGRRCTRGRRAGGVSPPARAGRGRRGYGWCRRGQDPSGEGRVPRAQLAAGPWFPATQTQRACQACERRRQKCPATPCKVVCWLGRPRHSAPDSGLCAGASPPPFGARVSGRWAGASPPRFWACVGRRPHWCPSFRLGHSAVFPTGPAGERQEALPLMLASQPERRDWVTAGVCPHAEGAGRKGLAGSAHGEGGCGSCCNLVCHLEGLGLILSLCQSRGVIWSDQC